MSNGLCSRCWQRHPDRARNQADNLALLFDDPPWWLGDFADFAAARHCMGRACVMITGLGVLLRDGQSGRPQELLERARRPGRSAGALARTLEDFFVQHDLAFRLDQDARLAAGRRHRRVEATPEPLRPVVALFCEYLVRSRERARRAGTHPRADSTIEATLAIVRDLARFLIAQRVKADWATVQTADIDAFLNAQRANRRRRLTAARQFFAWARRNKVVLVNPTSDMPCVSHHGFIGATLTTAEQRELFQRWSADRPDVHPHEALVGLGALLHAFTVTELRSLCLNDTDLRAQTIRVGHRPRPVPLDPVTLGALKRCAEHRNALGTHNPHLIVTNITKTRMTSASRAYVTHVLDPAGVNARTLRSTRLVDLLISLDPKVVAVALGMDPDGLLSYLADAVDQGRLAAPNL